MASRENSNSQGATHSSLSSPSKDERGRRYVALEQPISAHYDTSWESRPRTYGLEHDWGHGGQTAKAALQASSEPPTAHVAASSDRERGDHVHVSLADPGSPVSSKGDLSREAAVLLGGSLSGADDEFTFKRRSSTWKQSADFSHLSPHIGIIITQGQSRAAYAPSEETGDIDEEELGSEGPGRRVAYEDFTTIDWIHDIAKERIRQRHLRENAKYGWRGKARIIYDAMQAWIVVLTVGVAVGIIAGFIDISSEWLSDLKGGYCSTAFYLNKGFCCWGIDEGEVCDGWLEWGSALGVMSPTGGWWIGYLFYVIFAISFGAASALLVKTYAPYAAGSGIPEVKTILAGFVIRKFLGGWTLVVKSIGLCLSTAANMSLGKEGPLVHVACCCGNIFPRMFRKFKYNEAKKREVLSAASAAGVSVAFGAPIGGVLFSLEEVSYYFPSKTMWRSFFCAMIAAVSLQFLNPFRTGKLVLFQVQYDRDWHGFELIFFVILGIFGGLYGSLFIKYNMKIASYRKCTMLHHFPVEEVLAVVAVSSLVNYVNPFLKVGTVELVANLFRECEDGDFHGLCKTDGFYGVVGRLLIAAVIRIGLTLVTFGVKVPAGIFMPSMAVGACVGRTLGMIVQAWQRYRPMEFFLRLIIFLSLTLSVHDSLSVCDRDTKIPEARSDPGFWLFGKCVPDAQCVTPGTYAMVGAAATLGGVTRMTVSLVVIMFELTGALTYVLPIMIAVMTAKWIGDAFGKETIYDALCRLNGYPLLDSKEEYVHHVLAVQVMTTVDDLIVIPATGMTLDGLNEILHDTDYKGFPVVASTTDMTLVGFINRSEMKYAVSQARQHKPGTASCYFKSSAALSEAAEENFVDLRPWMDQTPITVTEIYQMDLVIDLFRKMGLRYVIVTNRGKLSGLISKKDVLRHVNMMKNTDVDSTYLRAIERRHGHHLRPPSLSPSTADAAAAAALADRL